MPGRKHKVLDSQSRGRILVIDDDEANRYVFRRILAHAGYDVDVAITAREGLARAIALPDLIICDVNLPDMLGYDVARRLKSNPLTMTIPLLQVSASFVSDESRVQALEGGADSYLTQPIDPTVLVAQVNALLRLRKAEALSHTSAVQWRSTFDSLTDGLAVADEDGVIVRANAPFVHLLDRVISEVEGKSLRAIFEAHFKREFAQFVEQYSAGHPVELFNGSKWFRVRYDRIESDPQNSSGSVLIMTDITNHKKLQETLKLSERLASTGRLAHIIAHEINNPLEAMSNLLYLAALSAEQGSDTHLYVTQASDELQRISQITKQVLAYHRDSKQPVNVDPNEILDSVVAMFRTHVVSSGIRLVTAQRCSALITVHPGEIRQVLTNLVSNALDAMTGTRGTLHIRCFDSRDARTNSLGARFVFSDSGSGIPSDVLPRIFDAFYTTKETKGSGVGLWLSGEVVAKHHGRIRIRTRTSGRYRGTLVDVFVPAHVNPDLD
jgi:two-component system NtrC family sensor kinase